MHGVAFNPCPTYICGPDHSLTWPDHFFHVLGGEKESGVIPMDFIGNDVMSTNGCVIWGINVQVPMEKLF